LAWELNKVDFNIKNKGNDFNVEPIKDKIDLFLDIGYAIVPLEKPTGKIFKLKVVSAYNDFKGT